MAAFRSVHRLLLYVPDLAQAIGAYQALGLSAELLPASGRDPRRAAVSFPEGPVGLELHSDPQRQFVDIEVRVDDVRDTYRALSRLPEVQWLQTPLPAPGGYRAVLRTPDGNIWVLVDGGETASLFGATPPGTVDP